MPKLVIKISKIEIIKLLFLEINIITLDRIIFRNQYYNFRQKYLIIIFYNVKACNKNK